MRRILAIAANDIRIELAGKDTFIFIVLLPLVFTAVIGLGLRDTSTKVDPNADNRFPLIVVNEDQSPLAESLITSLSDSTVVRLVMRSRSEAEASLEDKNTPAILIIPAGYGEKINAGGNAVLDFRFNPDDSRYMAIQNSVNMEANKQNAAVLTAKINAEAAADIKPFANRDAESAYYQRALTMASDFLSKPTAKVESKYASTTTVSYPTGFEQSSPGQIVTWVLITLLGASEVFVNERLGGTLSRLIVTPTRKIEVFLGKICGRLGLGFMQIALMILFGAFVLGVNWGRSPIALVLLIFSFSLAAVSLGVLLATFAKTRSQASWMTIACSMLMAALGGAWWPLEVTPATYQSIVRIFPSTWAMMGFNDIITRGLGLQAVLPEIGVLLLFALIYFVVAVRRLRFE